ncbi:biopolymer transporter ExbD [Dysgonomonas sp. 520]|uniref:ExbD/TolR family protein n=1 Tax=Dysgonomonas sp. 520 TaxID=2302931 RepID=UPI0013D0F495|nr:biopolymer transporter ExbD [Dysgonomonas sp. 520]NDW11105.1 biopolymer transporter ExbD [Dysgonomonas sp. 520]
MSKVKNKKHDTFIDMTAMSDMTVLLLTFFMLTANFIPKEPVQVMTPASVSEIKIPEYDVLTILIDPTGRVFLNLDKPEDKEAVLKAIGKAYNLPNFSKEQISSFRNQTSIGVSVRQLHEFLNKPMDEQDQMLKESGGVPTDTILGPSNQLAKWIELSKQANPSLALAIKADQQTPYPMVKKVFSTLQDLKENRYSLITTLRAMPAGL